MNSRCRERWTTATALILIAGVHALLLFRNTPTTYRYDELASAFLQGQTHRIEPPARELLALDDPYDAARNQTWREHDLVLFDGNYYYYWGPVPALLVAGVKRVFHSMRVSDAILAWIFAQLTILAIAKALAAIRRRWFPNASAVPIVACAFATGLATPMPFLFTRPSIYEAAILGGQCFLMSAAYFALTAMQEARISKPRLALAGLCAALAVGSRLNLAPAVAVLCVLLLWELHRRSDRPTWRAIATQAALLGTPLLIAAFSLAAYNHARFGSPSDSGIRYMLASRPGRTVLDRGQAFSTRYVGANLCNYLFAPIRITPEPPFFVPKRGVALAPPPRYYRTDIIAGLLVAAPFFVLSLVPIAMSMRSLTRSAAAWVSAALWTTAAIAIMLPVLIFFYCSIRYLADVTPALAILSAIGCWQMRGRAVHAVAMALLTYSCVVGVLLAITGYAQVL